MKKLFSKKYLLLIAILIIAVFLRFNRLSTNPPSLTWDEAAWGYNAYSLGVDGRDEFGRFLPLDYLESFGDFKPPVYAYLDIIPVKLFGVNEFAVRFPSALMGVLTILITYFLVQRLFFDSKHKKSYALFSALFLAISPWHVLLSRAAFEANVATFFIVFGIWGFLAGVQGKKWHLLLSVISFSLSIYTFNTARIVVPLLILLLAIVYRKTLFKIKREVLFSVLVGLLMLAPTVGFLLSPQASLRFKEVNIFSDINIIKRSNQQVKNDGGTIWSKIINNRRVFYSIEYAKHYFDNLSPNFLFIKGDGNPKFSIQDVGQMYLWDIAFVVSGMILLIRKKEGNWWIIPAWLLIGIIPAATARETPHALRIETTLPTFQIAVAYGFVNFLSWLKKFKLWKQRAAVGFVLIVLFLNAIYFLHNYFNHYPYEYSGEWQYGYKESIDYVKSVEKNYDYIQITNALGRPYVYYLFYTKTSPAEFRETSEIKRDAFGFVTVSSVGKYLFPENYDYSLSKKNKVLYVNTPYNLPKNIKVLKTFKLLNDQPILVAYEYE
jgi:4-amino-4-deoxy-L-arabinose transferase-like glycosyltransferase